MGIVLTRAEYFELRALSRDCDAIELEARLAAQVYARRLADATTRRQACYRALAERYGFDATKAYGWNDEACALTEPTGDG